jgi:hypothetical protein
MAGALIVQSFQLSFLMPFACILDFLNFVVYGWWWGNPPTPLHGSGPPWVDLLSLNEQIIEE